MDNYEGLFKLTKELDRFLHKDKEKREDRTDSWNAG